MLAAMTRVEIIGTRQKLDRTLSVLQEAGILHIEDAKIVVPDLAEAPAPTGEQEQIRHLLPQLESLLTALPLPPPPSNLQSLYEELSNLSMDQLLACADAAIQNKRTDIEKLIRRKETLLNERSILPRYREIISKFLPLTEEGLQTRDYEAVAVLIDRRYRKVLDLLEQELTHVSEERYEIVARNVDAETTAALIILPKQAMSQLQGFLNRKEISTLELPSSIRRDSLKETFLAVQERLKIIPEELQEVERSLREIAAGCYEELFLLRAVLHDRQTEALAREQTGVTNHSFLITGWVPRKQLATLKEMLQNRIGEEVILSEMRVSKDGWEEAPVYFDNPASLQPFEFLVKIQSLPRYATHDPTVLMAIFLPFFFGFMIGDIGHGLVMLALALWSKRRFKEKEAIRSIAGVLVAGSFWALIFGFIFGEFFGNLGELFGLYPLVDRSRAIVPLLVFVFCLGMAHVILGLLLGIWDAWRARRLQKLSERSGMLIGLCALFALTAVAAKQLPAHYFTPAIVLLLTAIAIMAVPRGFIGLILSIVELLGAFGNVLSYLRLAAIGLSTVFLAVAANEVAGATGNIWVGLIVGTLLHALNIALGLVSPAVQSLRLHYVEFFSKFFEQGGKPYRPFTRELSFSRS